MAINQFCINRFGLGPLHYLSSHSDFGFEFSEIFVENQLPASVSQGVEKIAWSIHFFKTLKQFNFDSKLHPWLIFAKLV